MNSLFRTSVAFASSCWLLIAAAGLARAEGAWTGLEVYPPKINLTTKLDSQSFTVVATRNDGVTLEVTASTKRTLAADNIARLEGNMLWPMTDGLTALNVEFEGMTKSVPIEVAAAGADRPVSFKLDVMPVFMRAGCNTGSCHGAARGKDGFRLSLFGYDPDGDHFRLTHEIGTRRINLALPRESLMIEKACGAVPHTGGKRFDPGSPYYAALLRWLEAGAPLDPANVPTVVGVDIYPPKAVLEGEGAKQQFVAVARYSDGTDRDVTSLAVFLTSNDNSAPITPDGLVTAAARGEAFVMARFNTYTVGSQVLALPKDVKYTGPTEKPVNYVDELVGDKLRKLRIEPSGLCSDEVFLRRATIDITGRLPTPEEYAAFIADQDAAKRTKLIDTLLSRKEFSEIWAMKWSELLMIKSSNQVEYKPMFLYSNWLTNQISENVPLDKMVRDLLAATGGTFTSPATNFYQIERDTLKTSENVAQVFMGIRVQCAQCHNHPFDQWTMDDYYSFAAFFSQIGRKGGEDYRETIVFNSGGGEVGHPVGGRAMPPKFLGGATPDVAGKDRRQVLADWLSSPQNPYFAPSVANRVWEHFFGIGIVEPVDDIRVSNPPSNPELFQALGAKLVEYNYDFKRLVKDICSSNAYQRTTERNASNATDEKNFAHGRIRRIKAESLLDCIGQVTNTKEKFRGLPLGARAVQIADGTTSNYFLTTFGRAKRDTVCACESTTEPTLSQALHLLNGPTAEGKIKGGGVIEKLLEEGKTPVQAVENLYVRCLSRKPTAEEIQRITPLLGADPKPVAPLQDVYWALLNSREFLFNH